VAKSQKDFFPGEYLFIAERETLHKRLDSISGRRAAVQVGGPVL